MLHTVPSQQFAHARATGERMRRCRITLGMWRVIWHGINVPGAGPDARHQELLPAVT